MAFNDDIGDVFIRHQVNLERFKAAERNKILKLLKSLEADLVAELAREDVLNPRTRYQDARIRALLQQTRETIATAYKGAQAEFVTDLEDLAKMEYDFAASAVNTLAQVPLLTVAVTAQQLRAIVSNIMIDGAPSSEWWSRQAATTTRVFVDTVRKGLISGRPTSQIAGDLRQYTAFNGMLSRNVNGLVRTSIAAVSNSARTDLFLQNEDVVGAIQQKSTLDGRTTLICISYSGKQWTNDSSHTPIGHSLPFVNFGGSPEGIPRHWGCRSFLTPVVKAFEKLDPTKKKGPQSVRDYFERNLRKQGFSETQIDQAIMRAQASMDGTVPEDWNYERWLKSKPAAFQMEVLGPGKYELWKRGKLNFNQLVDENGRPLSLEELRRLIAGAA